MIRETVSNSKTILVVEDDEAERYALVRLLEHRGYSVQSAASGAEAIDYLRNHVAPCLILLDMLLPSLNGYEFLSRKRRNNAWRAIPVIIISCMTDRITADLGAVRMFLKPMDPQQVLGAVAQTCPLA
jgi:CheY-like chemotaxis protein